MPGTTAENAESPPASPTQQPNRKAARNRLSCQVTLLDGTVFTTEMQKSAKGLDLVVWVTGQLNISEKEYFGLLFEDKKGEKYWLDPQKKITSQLKGAVPNFALAVKFYEPVPSQIKTDYTRYLMCMQIRDDINSGRLPCSFGNQAVLGSYIVQGDVGDFEVREHGEDYLDGMIFSPNQTQELLEKIKELHQENSGLSPEESDLQYLKIAAGKLILYGVDSHPARDEHGNEVLVGVSHDGLAVYKDRLVVNKIPWAKIDYLKYRKRNFIIKSHPGELDALTTITIYKTPSEKAAKRLYKSCVEHHTFFRLTFADPPPSRSSSLLKMGSKFRYSDRTLYQLRKDGEPIKNQPKFDRVSSRNWSRRYQMPSLSETRIYVDDKEDENRAKRPLSEGDMPSNVPLYLKRNPKQAPLIEEESNATMTPEEREQYQRQMAEKLGKRKPGEDDEDAIRASAVGGGVAYYAYGTAEDRDRKARVTALEDENKRLEKEGKEREEREREAREREARERDLEKERLAKERERERQMNEWIESEKRRFKPEVAGMAYTAPGGAYERANITIEEPKKSEEPEFVSMGVATPVTGGDTIKRAKMKVADTDSYQGRVVKMADSDKKQESPEISRTNTWGGGNRDNVSSYSRTYTSTTLPSRGAKITYDNKGAEMDRPRSANDLLDTNEREDRTRHSTGRVPLVTKEELVRIYSPGGAEMDSLGRPRDDAQHEIKRSLKDDLNLEHEQGEGGFVRENIKLNEGIIKRQSYRSDLESEPPEVTTRTMIINSEREPTVYRQNRAPEVATNVMTISSAGGKTPDSGAARGSTSPRYNDYSVGGVHQPYESHTREYTVPSVTTQKIVYDENGYPVSPSSRETQDGGVLVTRTITMGGAEPHRTETIRQTTMPTEIIQKTITIEGDGDQLTAQELKDIIAQHAGDLGTSEVVTTTYTTKVQEVKQTKTITETMRVVDDDGNIIKTGDPDTDAAILEAIERAKQENPNMKVTEVVITRTDESTA